MSEVMEKVKERPILFSGEMVRAILAGNKTMTRRVMKPQPVKAEGLADDGNDLWIWAERKRYGAVTSWAEPDTMTDKWALGTCPYGQVGDRLWVRESWNSYEYEGATLFNYRATSLKAEGVTWKPSIHMPRWASRILLEVTGVRVERVQDISESDAKAEGVYTGWSLPDGTRTYRGEFSLLWDTINAKRGYSWESNCFVWVVEFKRIEGGV